jgi:hypothetical protein
LRQKAYRKITDKQDIEIMRERVNNRWNEAYQKALDGEFDKEFIIQSMTACDEIDMKALLYNRKNPKDLICLDQRKI